MFLASFVHSFLCTNSFDSSKRSSSSSNINSDDIQLLEPHGSHEIVVIGEIPWSLILLFVAIVLLCHNPTLLVSVIWLINIPLIVVIEQL